MELVFPKLIETGEPALIEVTTRESDSSPATLNVRFALPEERLRAETDEGAVEGDGGPVVQFQMGLN